MNTEITRVTRAEAAVHANVSMRTISRWAASGALGKIHRPPSGSPEPVRYDLARVLEVARRSRRVVTVELPEPDISG